MARASVETRTVPRPVTEKVFVLELSEDEATTLGLIFHRIGGSSFTTRRKHAEAMNAALREVGVNPGYDQSDREVDNHTGGPGTIYFRAAT